MRRSHYHFIFTVALVSFGCHLVSNEVRDSFKTVDRSIKNSTAQYGDSSHWLMSEITADSANHPVITQKAGMVYKAYIEATVYIDSLKNLLATADTTLESIDIPTNILVQTTTGEILKQKMLALYTVAYDIAGDTGKAIINTIFNDRNALNKDWLRNNFHRTPTVAAITILSKLKNDCTNICLLTLKELHRDTSR